MLMQMRTLSKQRSAAYMNITAYFSISTLSVFGFIDMYVKNSKSSEEIFVWMPQLLKIFLSFLRNYVQVH